MNNKIEIAKGFKIYNMNDLIEMGVAESRKELMGFIKDGKLGFFKPSKLYKFTSEQVKVFIETYSSNK